MTETLHSVPAFREAIARHPLVMLFKHSPVCPISAKAHREWQAFIKAHPEVPTLFVDVIADRPTSRGLAQECGVEHQSPQAILFRDGKPSWHASHGDITAKSLAAAAQ